jgi:hypothetical protein
MDQVALRKDFYGFVMHLRKTAVDADRWVVSPRAGKDTESIDRVPTGGSTKSYTSGFSSGSRLSTAKTARLAPARARFQRVLMTRHETNTGG